MTAESEGQTLAEQYRDRHALGLQPLGDLVALIERLEQIDVAILPVTDPDAHGLTMSDPATGVTRIAAAATGNPMRQRSTLAHELAHHLFDDHLDPTDPQWGRPGHIESRATAFARHLLLPLAAVDVALNDLSRKDLTEAHLSSLVQQFGVSPAMAAIQLRQCSLISEARKHDWASPDMTSSRLAARYGWSDQYAAMSRDSQVHRSPQRLLAQLTEAYLDGVVGISAIASVRRLPESVVESEFRETGLVSRSATAHVPDAELPTRLEPADLAGLDAVLDDSRGDFAATEGAGLP